MYLKSLVILLIVGMLTVPALLGSSAIAGTPVTVDLEKLSPTARNEILNMQKEAAKKKVEENITDPAKWVELAELGKGIGVAIGETCKALNQNINDFIKTPAGYIIIGMVAYKIIGGDLLDIVLGIPIWAILTLILLWSYRKFHMRERLVIYDEPEDGKKKKKVVEVKYIPRYEFKSNDSRTASFVLHILIWCAFNITFLALIFG